MPSSLNQEPYEVICVGSVSKDLFFPTGEGLIIETPQELTSKRKIAFELGGKYRVADRYEAVGGVAANVAHGLTRLGHRAGCYSRRGCDEIGNWIESEFLRRGVPTEFLFADPEVKSDLSAIIVLTPSGERTIFHNRDANEHIEITEEPFSRTRWVFVSALNGDWETNLRHLLRLKKAYGFSLALNPGQHNIRENPGLLFETLAAADVLILNKDEAIELLQSTKPDSSPQELDNEQFLLGALRDAGAGIVAMTDGKRGAWCSMGDESWHCPIQPTGETVDSTGAGDAFSSGFFAALLEGKPATAALKYGMANSASVITSYGAIEGLLDRAAMEKILPLMDPERLP